MQASGKGLLKVTGILMIIFGGFSVILAIISIIGSAAAAVYLPRVGAILIIASIISLIGAALELVTGIIGVKNCNDPTKAKPCIILCAVIILLAIISFIINLCSGGAAGTAIVSFILGLVIPGLYMWGAIKNYKQADAQ